MAKVRNAANTIRQGRIGENTWYVRDGIQVVRQRLQNSNYGEGARRSSAQQERRAKWGNLVNFYKAIKSWQPKAYESLKKGVTDYNAFMQLNANSTPIYLTRQLVEAGGAVPSAFQVSKGSLSAVALSAAETPTALTCGTNLAFGSVAGQEPTWGDYSRSLVNNNQGWLDGDNFAVIVFDFTMDGNVPRVRSRYYEFTVDVTSTEDMGNFTDILFSVNSNNKIELEDMAGDQSSECAFAVIHSRMEGAQLKVSTASLFMTRDVAASYITPAAKAAAIASYGVDGDVPLAPGE